MKKNTAADFENAGYSKADAARLAADPAKNWKAANGGARGMTLKQMQRQQHREAAQRLDAAKKRGDARAIVIESVNFHASKP